MTVADVKLDEGAIRSILADPAGGLARMIREAAEGIARIARATVHVRTGETRSSIDTRYYDTPTSIYAVAHASYAVFFLERGTKPHLIESHGKWPLRSDEGEVFGRIVHHPGSHKAPFLTTGLWTVPVQES